VIVDLFSGGHARPRRFTGQYWFECFQCPAKQFIYAADWIEAREKIVDAGWLIRPTCCPACNRELSK
jgi:hypothetical protein